MWKLYPNFITTFATLDEAVAYALEVDGYRQLWMWILQAEQLGVLSAN